MIALSVALAVFSLCAWDVCKRWIAAHTAVTSREVVAALQTLAKDVENIKATQAQLQPQRRVALSGITR